MTITSGRQPSNSIDARRSSAWGAPFRLSHDVDVGLAVEEREQPAAHDLVVVDDQDSDGLIRSRLHLSRDRLREGRGLVRPFRTRACS